jgi:hypothetical protein
MKKKVWLWLPFVFIAVFSVLFLYRNIFVFEPTFEELQTDMQELLPGGVTLLTQDEQNRLSMWDFDQDEIREGVVFYEYPQSKQKEMMILKKEVFGYEVTKVPLPSKDKMKQVKIQDVNGDKRPEIAVVQEQEKEANQRTDFDELPKPKQQVTLFEVDFDSKTVVKKIDQLEGAFVFASDLDKDQKMDIVVFQLTNSDDNPMVDEQTTYLQKTLVHLYQAEGQKLVLKQTIDLGLQNDIEPYYGKLRKDGTEGFIVSQVVGAHSQEFSVLVMEQGKLKNVVKDNNVIINVYPHLVMDVNQDGILDVPYLKPDTKSSYGDLPMVEMRFIREWKNLNEQNQFVTVEKSIGYQGLEWILPKRLWKSPLFVFDANHIIAMGVSATNVGDEFAPGLVEILVVKKARLQDLRKYGKLEVLQEYKDFVFVGVMLHEKELENLSPEDAASIKKNAPSVEELRKNLVLWPKEDLDRALSNLEKVLEENPQQNPFEP